MFKHAVVLMAVGGMLAAQTQPLFRSGTRLIQVDVVVQNKQGPVRGLTKNDFTILDRGKAQNIAVFSVTDVQAAKAAAETRVVSNRINSEGQVSAAMTVILFDRINTGSQAQAVARKQILALLSSLKPTDRIALYSLDTRLALIHPFTRPVEPLIRAAKALSAQGDNAKGDSASDQKTIDLLKESLTAFQNGIDNAGRVEATMTAFHLISRHMAGIPGRKNLIWMTASVPFTYGSGVERRQDDEMELNGMIQILSDGNIALYPVDPRGAGTSSFVSGGTGAGRGAGGRGGGGSVDTLAGIEGLRKMADQTGGKAYSDTNDVSVPTREILNSAEVTYTLGFYVDSKSLDGKSHDLTVKLGKRPETSGANVFHRRNYLATPPEIPESQIPTMEDLINDEEDATGIGILAVFGTVPDKPGTGFVEVKVDMNDLQFRHLADHWLGEFDLGMAVVGREGQVSVKPINLNLTQEQFEQALAKGLTVENVVPIPDKALDLRVVVQDKSRGSAGSVKIRLEPKPGEAKADPEPKPAEQKAE